MQYLRKEIRKGIEMKNGLLFYGLSGFSVPSDESLRFKLDEDEIEDGSIFKVKAETCIYNIF